MIIVAIRTITTTARQPTRIKMDLDSVDPLAPESEFGLTGSKIKDEQIVKRMLCLECSLIEFDRRMN